MRTVFTQNRLPWRGLRALAFAGIAVIGATGCATTPEVVNDGSQLLQISWQWQDHLANERFSRALALVSDDFTSRAWPDKASLTEYFAVAKDRGLFSNATIPPEEVSVSLTSGEARVYPVGIRANLGLALFDLSFRKEQSDWKVTSFEMELY